MSHKRYQSPSRGYSRRQQKSMADVAIEEELEFEEQLAKTSFGDQSITSLMAAPPESPAPAGSIDVDAAPAPQGLSSPPISAMTVSELMAYPGATDLPPPHLEHTPERAPVTRVVRGPMGEANHETNPQIERLDRLLAAIRRER